MCSIFVLFLISAFKESIYVSTYNSIKTNKLHVTSYYSISTVLIESDITHVYIKNKNITRWENPFKKNIIKRIYPIFQ